MLSSSTADGLTIRRNCDNRRHHYRHREICLDRRVILDAFGVSEPDTHIEPGDKGLTHERFQAR
jgi:hypothetical protein